MNFNGYRDFLHAIKVIEKNVNKDFDNSDFSSYVPCYKFSNENLSGYYPKFNIDGEHVLTVCGSGDQVLSSILYGAKDVDCFDSNTLTYYNLMLKVYSIKYLEFGDFLSFFGLSSYHFDKKYFYNKFNDKIDDRNVKEFFDLLFESGLNINYLYNNSDTCYVENLVSSIPYLNYDSYYKLRHKLEKCPINFVISDLFDIYNHFDKKYSFINLSNICDYFDNLTPFYSFINETCLNHLTSVGGIMVNYSWNRPYYNQTNNMIAEIIGGYQSRVDISGYNDDPDSIVYIKK